jgi:hypothetical protein
MEFKSWLKNPICEITYSEKKGLDTKEIISFLRKSVVRKPVYHGTDQNFQEFQKMSSQRFVLFSAYDVQAQGFFFSENIKEAKTYGRRVITAYVRMERPLLDPRTTKRLGIDRLPSEKEAQIAYILRHTHGKDDAYYGKYMDIGVQRHRIEKDFAKNKDYGWIYYAVSTGGLHWDVLDNPKVADSMKRLGYDGTFVHEYHSELDRSIFVMSPEQIKIVDVRIY